MNCQVFNIYTKNARPSSSGHFRGSLGNCILLIRKKFPEAIINYHMYKNSNQQTPQLTQQFLNIPIRITSVQFQKEQFKRNLIICQDIKLGSPGLEDLELLGLWGEEYVGF